MIDKIENIPNSWCVVRVEQVGELLRGINYNKLESSSSQQEHYLPILRSNNIQESLIFDDLVYVDKKNFNSFHSLRKGDILFAMSSGSKHLVGKTAKVTLDCNYGWGAFCAVLRPFEIVDKNFIAYFFKAPSYKKLVSEISKGTNINNLKREHILDLIFPLPPLPEQQRIVAKIEELFSELDKGIETLKTAQQQLKVYRQAVLKYAFEGRLTNPEVKEGELPEGWVEATFQDVSIKIGDIDHKMPSKVAEGVFPYLSTGDITDDNKLDFSKCKLISKEDFLRLSKKIKPQKGDIIFPRYGTIGRNVLVQTDIDFLISYSCAIIKPNPEKICSNYFYHFTLSSLTNKEIKKYIVQTTQANVGISSIKSFIITLPESILEQQKVVQEIESRLSVCDKIEESIEQGLQQAEALRQSILKKAFEGKLVPQDPNDEPASVLLERIKAERQKALPEKKTKTKKVKA